jgi:hypothetical protein
MARGIVMRFTKENTPEGNDDDIRKMNERYYIVADSVRPGGFTPDFLEKLAEVIREEVMVQRRLREAFRDYQRKGGTDGG